MKRLSRKKNVFLKAKNQKPKPYFPDSKFEAETASYFSFYYLHPTLYDFTSLFLTGTNEGKRLPV